jgi:hypothetical protein
VHGPRPSTAHDGPAGGVAWRAGPPPSVHVQGEHSRTRLQPGEIDRVARAALGGVDESARSVIVLVVFVCCCCDPGTRAENTRSSDSTS